MKIKRAIGIDLGTTNSALAMMSLSGGDVLLFEDRFKRKTFPSVVGWEPEEGSYVSGWDAWNRRALEPIPISSIKRKMGQSQKVLIGPNELTPEEVSAEILTTLISNARTGLGELFPEDELELQQAVITVPAYFDAPQIDATRRAGELAGIEVISLVQEPTAAAMFHAWRNSIGDGNFLVYDLGGGTFDVSVIRSLMGEYQVLGIAGDNFLGGDDFDKRLAEYFRKHLVEVGYALELDLANPEDATRFFLLTHLAREVKEALSSTDVHYVARRDIFTDHEGQSVSVELELSRTEFEGLIGDLVQQTVECCHEALALSLESGDVSLEEVQYVVLVGGSTRVPLVRQTIQEIFIGDRKGARTLLDESPDTCVAKGAAIQAANLGGLELQSDSDFRLKLSTPLYSHENALTLIGSISGEAESKVDSVVLLTPTGEISGIARPTARENGLGFEFESVALPALGSHRFDLEICDEEGDPISTFALTMERGDLDEYRPTGGALSNPSVLAKDIYLQVSRDGRTERQLLLRRGTGLPAQEKFRFRTSDQSGAVILRLFQNHFPIRTIHLAVPSDLAIGSPVDLNLRVDETMVMIADGEIAGQKFWAQVESPPEREERDWASIEQLLADVDTVNRNLWGYESEYFRRKTDILVAGIHETARTDPDKRQALVGRLEDFVEDYRNRDTAITPAWARFEQLADAIKRVVYRGDGAKQLGMDTEGWRQKLTTLESEAREIYDAEDQEMWTRSFNQIQAIWESLAQDAFRFSSSEDPRTHVERLAGRLRGAIDDLRTDISGYQFSQDPETQLLQQAEVSKLGRALEQTVETPFSGLDLDSLPVAHAKPALERLFETLSHLRRQYERLPTLGVVAR